MSSGNCMVCGDPYTARTNTVCCSPECRKERRRFTREQSQVRREAAAASADLLTVLVKIDPLPADLFPPVGREPWDSGRFMGGPGHVSTYDDFPVRVAVETLADDRQAHGLRRHTGAEKTGRRP